MNSQRIKALHFFAGTKENFASCADMKTGPVITRDTEREYNEESGVEGEHTNKGQNKIKQQLKWHGVDKTCRMHGVTQNFDRYCNCAGYLYLIALQFCHMLNENRREVQGRLELLESMGDWICWSLWETGFAGV